MKSGQVRLVLVLTAMFYVSTIFAPIAFGLKLVLLSGFSAILVMLIGIEEQIK